jgi:hypothetical protein
MARRQLCYYEVDIKPHATFFLEIHSQVFQLLPGIFGKQSGK